MTLFKKLREIESDISYVRANGLDLSKEYFGENEDCIECGYQEKLSIGTRSLFIKYLDSVAFGVESIGLSRNKRILEVLDDVKEIFGNHPFCHVIKGRIATIVKSELEKGGNVPPEYIDDYAYFEFRPWNDPHINYNTPRDIMMRGNEEDQKMIPPDWKP